jgi:hypothetical protein
MPLQQPQQPPLVAVCLIGALIIAAVFGAIWWALAMPVTVERIAGVTLLCGTWCCWAARRRRGQ